MLYMLPYNFTTYFNAVKQKHSHNTRHALRSKLYVYNDTTRPEVKNRYSTQEHWLGTTWLIKLRSK